MHSSAELRSDEFEITLGGRPASIDDVLPDFGEQSRIGVVLRDDFAGVGASSLLTAAITAFYDIQRSLHPDGFYRYVDYFLFHADHIRGCHAMLDVFSDHKEVVVPDDPESILRAVNDRGITHLVVPEIEPRRPDFSEATLNSAKDRIEGALVYSPSGRVDDADVEIKGNAHVDFYVWATLKPDDWLRESEQRGADAKQIAWERSRLGEVSDEVASKILAERDRLQSSGRTVETYRRASLEEALCRLSPNPAADLV